MYEMNSDIERINAGGSPSRGLAMLRMASQLLGKTGAEQASMLRATKVKPSVLAEGLLFDRYKHRSAQVPPIRITVPHPSVFRALEDRAPWFLAACAAVQDRQAIVRAGIGEH